MLNSASEDAIIKPWNLPGGSNSGTQAVSWKRETAVLDRRTAYLAGTGLFAMSPVWLILSFDILRTDRQLSPEQQRPWLPRFEFCLPKRTSCYDSMPAYQNVPLSTELQIPTWPPPREEDRVLECENRRILLLLRNRLASWTNCRARLSTSEYGTLPLWSRVWMWLSPSASTWPPSWPGFCYRCP